MVVQDQVQSIHQLPSDLFQNLQAKWRNSKSLDKDCQGFVIQLSMQQTLQEQLQVC